MTFESNSGRMVVIAAYNEAANLEKLVPAIVAASPGAGVLVVDDNSPDGTAELLRRMQQTHRELHFVVRPGKLGYGTAVLAGVREALRLGATSIATMDADFSHDPAALPELFAATEGACAADVAVGSRYFQGVRVLNWHPNRLLLSLFANRYVRGILGLPVHDATSGFRTYSRRAGELVGSVEIGSKGYSFLVEILYMLHRRGMRLVEVPIIYTERREGESKMDGAVILEAVFRPWVLRFRGR